MRLRSGPVGRAACLARAWALAEDLARRPTLLLRYTRLLLTEALRRQMHDLLGVALDEPRILVFGASANDLAAWRIGGSIGHPLDPGRWAEERQYLRNDTREALAAFQRRRGEVLVLLRSLSAAEWQRGGVHLNRGRLTLADWVARLAAHDDNHVAQLLRAVEGRA